MAEIEWAPDIRITEIALTAANPGQIIHEIPTTGSMRVFNRGVGFWQGTITFGQLDNMTQGQNVEAFIATLNGSQNITRIPLTDIKRFRNQSNTPIPLSNAVPGRYYNYKDRLILVNKNAIFPEIPINPSESVVPASFVRVRLAPNSNVLMRHRPETYGPWVLSWREALGG